MLLPLASAFYLIVLCHSGYLLWTAPRQRGRPLLIVFLGAIAVLMANYVLWGGDWLTPTAQEWANRLTHRTLPFLIGPTLYGYLRLTLDPSFRLKPRHLWHGLPYLVAFVLTLFVLPTYLPGWAEQTKHLLLPADQWPKITRTGYILGYAGFGFRLIIRQPTLSEQARPLTIAVLVLGSGSILIATVSSLVLGNQGKEQVWSAIAALCLVPMIYGLTQLINKPQIGELATAPDPKMPSEPATVDEPEPVAKYRHSALDEAAAQHLLIRAETYLTHNQAYHNPDLDLAQLAQALAVPVGQLSQAINQAGGITFYELINRYRIAEACRLLTDAKHQHLSVSGVGFEVGFRSKSTFYEAFRRFQEQTPSEYRKKARNEGG